jgi:hypothetical protein
MKTVLQVLVGLILFGATVALFIYTQLPICWEHEDQPNVYTITWRSGIMVILFIAITQGISFLAFRRVRKPSWLASMFLAERLAPSTYRHYRYSEPVAVPITSI